MKKEHSLFIEKYRAKTLEEYIGNEELKQRIEKCMKENDIPHFLFYGPTGTGKTSLAKIIVNTLDCDYIYINASDDNGIDTIREKVKSFASSATFKPLKIVILDEAGRLTIQAQEALLGMIEEYSKNTRFIITTNNIQKIIAPLRSRCELHKVITLSKPTIARHLVSILDKENITYNLDDVAKIIKSFYPDIRSMLKVIQSHLNDKNELVLQEEIKSSYDLILEKLKSSNKDSWKQIRQLVADSGEEDYTPFYQYLYDRTPEFAPDNEAQAVIIIDEYLWRSTVILDKEINFMACIGKLIENK